MLRRRIPPWLRVWLLRVRAGAGAILWRLHPLDPVTARTRRLEAEVRRQGRWQGADVVLASVYRAGNGPNVARIVEEASRWGWQIRLWALDEAFQPLEPWTVGTGPGMRSDLLNGLLSTSFEWAVAVDDDVEVARGSLGLLLDLADRARLDMVQPAHTPDSAYTFSVTRVHPLRLVRQTTFVEVGPVLAVSRSVAEQILPFPEGSGMGWGLDAQWALKARAGKLRLGVIDAVAIRHLAAVGTAYGREESLQRLDEELARLGVKHMRSLQRTSRSWSFWQMPSPR